MAGGYLSFSGFEAKAKFHGSPIEEILPVALTPYDDRVEAPQGAQSRVEQADHPILRGVGLEWPVLLGYNKVALKPSASLVASVDGDPLIAVHEVGHGRAAVWTSDIGPHWCPEAFVQWPGFSRLMSNLIEWLGKRT